MNIFSLIDTNIYACLFVIIIYIFSKKLLNITSAMQTLKVIVFICCMQAITECTSVILTSLSISGSRTFLIVINTLLFFNSVYLECIWNSFLYKYSAESETLPKNMRILIYGPCILNCFLLVYNLFSGCLFTIEENLKYVRGNLFFTQTLIGAVAALLSIFLLVHYSKKLILKERVIFSLFLFLPIVGMLAQSLFYGIYTTWVSSLFMLALVFIFLKSQFSNFDPLTKAWSRGSFERFLDHSKETKFALAFMDLDDFKKINDTMGHGKGDDLLTTFASILTANLMQGAILVRFGGDEFVIYYPTTITEEIEKNLRQIDSSIISFNKENPERNLYNLGFTYDYGLYDPSFHVNPAHLLREVDEKMYAKKLAKKLNKHILEGKKKFDSNMSQ
ncbi:MAG: GGDEF domain-containing protein [Clostridia bacterium]